MCRVTKAPQALFRLCPLTPNRDPQIDFSIKVCVHKFTLGCTCLDIFFRSRQASAAIKKFHTDCFVNPFPCEQSANFPFEDFNAFIHVRHNVSIRTCFCVVDWSYSWRSGKYRIEWRYLRMFSPCCLCSRHFDDHTKDGVHPLPPRPLDDHCAIPGFAAPHDSPLVFPGLMATNDLLSISAKEAE